MSHKFTVWLERCFHLKAGRMRPADFCDFVKEKDCLILKLSFSQPAKTPCSKYSPAIWFVPEGEGWVRCHSGPSRAFCGSWEKPWKTRGTQLSDSTVISCRPSKSPHGACCTCSAGISRNGQQIVYLSVLLTFWKFFLHSFSILLPD